MCVKQTYEPIKKNISDFLPKIKTTTSKVYDYSLGNSKEIPSKHLCLPIWFELEEQILKVEESIMDLEQSIVDKIDVLIKLQSK